MATSDVVAALSGDQRNAYTAVYSLLQQYGLESLADTVLGYVQQGYSSDTIAVLLPTTPAYQQRFSANAVRQKNGLPVLSPAEYLSTEDSYRQIMSANGLPPGFYDQPSDFTNWLANDVSPSEIQDRVNAASTLVNTLDEAAKAEFGKWYTNGDMVAYALDRDRSTTLLNRQIVAAQAGGAGALNGIDVGQAQAEHIAQAGYSGQQAQQGVAQAASLAKPLQTLSSIYGGNYSEADALAEVFDNSDPATQKRKTLASQERATFGGSAGSGATSLTARRPGQV
jgi:hypothetical protein